MASTPRGPPVGHSLHRKWPLVNQSPLCPRPPLPPSQLPLQVAPMRPAPFCTGQSHAADGTIIATGGLGQAHFQGCVSPGTTDRSRAAKWAKRGSNTGGAEGRAAGRPPKGSKEGGHWQAWNLNPTPCVKPQQTLHPRWRRRRRRLPRQRPHLDPPVEARGQRLGAGPGAAGPAPLVPHPGPPRRCVGGGGVGAAAGAGQPMGGGGGEGGPEPKPARLSSEPVPCRALHCPPLPATALPTALFRAAHSSPPRNPDGKRTLIVGGYTDGENGIPSPSIGGRLPPTQRRQQGIG